MQRSLPTVLSLAALISASTFGQYVCPTVTPNIIPPYTNAGITVSVQDATGAGYQYRTNCLTTSITIGSPTGPFVNLGLFLCLTSYQTVAPYGTATKSYSLPNTLAPGIYFVKVQYRLIGTTTLLTEYVPFQVAVPTDPTLTATTIAQVGQTLSIDISAPAHPYEVYIAAAALTTDVGIPVAPGLTVALDNDAIFGLTFPVPLAGVFDNFQGNLDGSGFFSGINVNFPNVPALAYLPFHVQAAVVPFSGSPIMTNCLNFCIAP